MEPTLKKLYYKSIIKTCVDSVDGCRVCELVLGSRVRHMTCLEGEGTGRVGETETEEDVPQGRLKTHVDDCRVC